MLLYLISEITDQTYAQRKTVAADMKPTQKGEVKVENPEKTEEAVKTPSHAATSAAAAQAKGMKKIELEIAAAAGLLRPISAKTPTENNEPEPYIKKDTEHDFETLLKTLKDLENPEKLHSFDLFE